MMFRPADSDYVDKVSRQTQPSLMTALILCFTAFHGLRGRFLGVFRGFQSVFRSTYIAPKQRYECNVLHRHILSCY